MESTLKPEILYRLKKIESAVQRLITQNEKVETVNDYYCTPWGMERLESSCMLLIAVGESIKGTPPFSCTHCKIGTYELML